MKNKKRKYQVGGNTQFVNKTGYLGSELSKLNPYNIIPLDTSKKITTEGVSEDLLAMLYKENEMVGMRFMEPDNNFVFRSADSVLETPLYQFGGAFGGQTGSNIGTPPYMSNQSLNPFVSLSNVQFNTPPFLPDERFGNFNNQIQQPLGNNSNGLSNSALLTQDPNFNRRSVGLDEVVVTGERLNNINPTSTSPNSNINSNLSDLERNLEEIELDTLDTEAQESLDFANSLPKTEDNLFKLPEDYSENTLNKLAGTDPFQQNSFYNPYSTPTVEQGFRTLGMGVQNGNIGQILAGGAKGLLGSARGFFSGMGTANSLQRAEQERDAQQRRINTPTQFVQQGGRIFSPSSMQYSLPQSKKRRKKRYRANEEMNEFRELTGDFATGVEPKLEDQATAEVEVGEFLKDSATGKVQKVLGKTHEQGGEKMFLKEGDRVLTDHLKLGGKKAKLIRDRFDIEVKAKNTFADVLDKYRKKSGLAKATKEEEGILKKLKEQGEEDIITGADKTTDKINTQFLLNSLEELKAKKQPLTQGMEGLYDVLFEMQEKSKKGKEAPKNKQGQIIAQGGNRIDLDKFGIPQSEEGDTGLFGGIGQQGLNDFVNENSTWYDFNNFNPANEDDVRNFQTEFNKRSGANAQLRVDGMLGQQTSSARLNPIVKEEVGQLNNGITAPLLTTGIETTAAANKKPTEPNTVKDKKTTGTSDETTNLDKAVKGYNKVFPNVPSTYLPFLGQMLLDDLEQVNFREVEPRLQNIDTQLQIAQEQRQIQQRQLEGLSPEARAAVSANSEANLNRALQSTASQIDNSNLDRLQRADQANATLDAREQQINAGFQQQLERNNIMAFDNFNQEVANNFDTNMNNRLQNFSQINRMNLYLAANPDIGVNFDGTFNSRKVVADPFGTVQTKKNN